MRFYQRSPQSLFANTLCLASDVAGILTNPQDRIIDSNRNLTQLVLGVGDAVHWLRFEGAVEELYDVAVLPGVVRPKALGFQTDEIRHQVCFSDDGQRPMRWFQTIRDYD